MGVNRGCSGLVLAGGKSRRMGIDKAELLMKGKTFLEWQLEKLGGLGLEKVLVSREDHIPDIYPGKGPLGGLHAGLSRIETADCLVISVDCPLVPLEHLRKLMAVHTLSGAKITVTRFGDRVQPLIGVYSGSLVPIMEEKLQRNQCTVMKFLDEVGFQTVDYTGDPDLLMNCNTKQEYENLVCGQGDSGILSNS